MAAVFATILLILSTLLDVAISHKLRNCDAAPYMCWDVVYNDTVNYDIVINGSSRAYVQYNPFILDSVLGYKTYNFGMDGSSINRQIIKYQTYCRIHNTHPKLLIQNIDLLVLRITKGYEREQFLPFFFYDNQMIDDFDKYEDFGFADRHIPLLRYYGYGNKIIPAIRAHHNVSKGYAYGRNFPWDGSTFRELDTLPIGKDKEAISIFDDFLGEVIASGTDVILVYAPIYSGVYKKVHKEEMYEIFGKIADEYNIPILNYNEIEMCNDTNMFYNATHLNYTGSKIFTRMLASDIDSLIKNGVVLRNE